MSVLISSGQLTSSLAQWNVGMPIVPICTGLRQFWWLDSQQKNATNLPKTQKLGDIGFKRMNFTWISWIPDCKGLWFWVLICCHAQPWKETQPMDWCSGLCRTGADPVHPCCVCCSSSRADCCWNDALCHARFKILVYSPVNSFPLSMAVENPHL